MVDAGTEFFTILTPVDYDRPNAYYPFGDGFDRVAGIKELGILFLGEAMTEPLAAGLGRYMMLGACGNLQKVDGVEQCGIYEDRPQVCRDFKRGGPACGLFRGRRDEVLASLELPLAVTSD